MKIKSFALLSMLASISASNAQYVLDQIQSADWAIGRSTTLVGIQTTQTITDTAATNINVGKYTGGGTLHRVVITYVQPDPPTSSTLTGSVSITDGSGSTNFSSLSVGNSTQITTPFGSLIIPIFSAGGPILNSTETVSDSDSTSGLLIAPSTMGFSVDYSRNQTIFDSALYPGITNAELASIFVGGSPFAFNISSSVQFAFSRDNTESITLQTSGTDTGYIQIAYYIPEPSTAGLAGLAAAGLLIRRRRR